MYLNYMNNTENKQLLINTLSKVLSCHFSISMQILFWKAVKIFTSMKHLLLLFKKTNQPIKITVPMSRKTSKYKENPRAFQYEFLIKKKLVEYVVLLKSVGTGKCSKLKMGLCTCLIWVLSKRNNL